MWALALSNQFSPTLLKNIRCHTEFFSLSAQTLELLIEKYGRIITVGTTTLRTLESLYWLGIKASKGLFDDQYLLHLDQWEAYELEATLSYPEAIKALLDFLHFKGMQYLNATTRIMIIPGYRIRSIQALITNFHQPKSTLLCWLPRSLAMIGKKYMIMPCATISGS